MLNNIPKEWIGFRVCTNCGEIMSEGFYLNGDYACCDECGIALFGGDESAFYRALEKEQESDGATECYYTEWYDERAKGEKEGTLSFDSKAGYRFCANCGKKIQEGFNLDGECACSWDCAVELYGYDIDSLQRDLDEEKQHPDSTKCKWMKWDVRYDGMTLRSCYRLIEHRFRYSESRYCQEERYFTRKRVAEHEYERIRNTVDIQKEEWVLLEQMEFIDRGRELEKPRHTLLRFCGNFA